MSVRVSLFGAIHFDRPGVVTSELRRVARDADAICVEWSRVPDERALLSVIARFPTFLLGFALYSLLLGIPGYALFNRDLRSTEYGAAERVADGRPVHEVDRSPFALLAERDRWWAWAAGNWLVVGGLAAVLPVATAVTAAGLFAGVFGVGLLRRLDRPRVAATLGLLAGVGTWWFVLADVERLAVAAVAYVTFAVAVGATLEEREALMLEQITGLADDRGYDEVCIATGYMHLAGFVDAADGRAVSVVSAFRSRWLTEGLALPVEGGNRYRAVHVMPDMETVDGVLGRRAAATLVDWVVVAAGLGVVGSTLFVARDWFWAAFVAWFVLALVYHPLQELRFGRSLGKRAMGLVVVRTDGSPVDGRSILLRWLARPVDFLPVGYVAGAVALATTRGRRLGDLLAGTTVVETDTSRPS